MSKSVQPNWQYTEMRKQSLRKAQAISRKMRKMAKIAIINDGNEGRAKNALNRVK